MRTLVVGSGFVGRALGRHLSRTDGEAVLASRTPPAPDGHHPPQSWARLDVTEPGALSRMLDDTGADSVVLVHGPSDVTWCEQHPMPAMEGHVRAAQEAVAAAGSRRVVFISTDNVFDGGVALPGESALPQPPNAYGRAKLAAEGIVSELANAVVLRVSLIYGWEPVDSPKWLNFYASCVHRLSAGQSVTVPYDQWTTPVFIDDVIEVTAALVRAPSPPRLLHLGGPDRISRAEWAVVIAEHLGVPASRVVAEPRANGRYAHRPASTCLGSELLDTHPATAGIALRSVHEASRLLVDRHTTPAQGGLR